MRCACKNCMMIAAQRLAPWHAAAALSAFVRINEKNALQEAGPQSIKHLAEPKDVSIFMSQKRHSTDLAVQETIASKAAATFFFC